MDDTHARALYKRLCESPDAVRAQLQLDVPEDEYVDFKRVSTADAKLTAAKPKLERDDVKNLAAALSGFYNSLGGVLVWGVDCDERQVLPEERKLLPGLPSGAALRDAIRSRVLEITQPPIRGLEFEVLPADETGREILLMYVPSRDYRAPALANDNRYYFRVADKFAPVPPDFLAEMLGVAPPPLLHLEFPHQRYDPAFSAGQRLTREVHVRNIGRGVAARPYVLLRGPAGMSAEGGQWFSLLKDLNGEVTLIAGNEVVLPPGGSVAVGVLSFFVERNALAIEVQCGAGSAVPVFETWEARPPEWKFTKVEKG